MSLEQENTGCHIPSSGLKTLCLPLQAFGCHLLETGFLKFLDLSIAQEFILQLQSSTWGWQVAETRKTVETQVESMCHQIPSEPNRAYSFYMELIGLISLRTKSSYDSHECEILFIVVLFIFLSL